MNSIPVIGTAVVNSTYWVNRLISSVDYPVDNFVIINNNGRGELDNDLDKIKSLPHKFIKKISVVHMPANIGVAGAWNLIIKCYMQSPYWIIVNDDVAFGIGFLEEMHRIVNSDSNVGLIHGFKGDFEIAGSWDLFLIRDTIIELFGLFDENLYPAYCEDADYIMRTIHRPIHKVLDVDKPYYHGFGQKNEYYVHGSQTKKTDPELTDKLAEVNDLNIQYLTQKWGKDWRICAPTYFPFESSNGDIKTTTYDLKFVRKKHLGF